MAQKLPLPFLLSGFQSSLIRVEPTQFLELFRLHNECMVHFGDRPLWRLVFGSFIEPSGDVIFRQTIEVGLGDSQVAAWQADVHFVCSKIIMTFNCF